MAAFDFDGTLVPGDSLHPFLLQLIGPTRTAVALVRAAPAMTWGYLAGGRDQAKVELLARAVAGLPAGDVEATGRAFARQLAGRVRPDLTERIAWHRRQGHRLVLVSASLTAYLEPLAAALAFDDLIATELEVGSNRRLTGRLAGKNVRGPEKASRLRAVIGTEPAELWAYGDSKGDREMLAMADHPTLVRGNRLPPKSG